MPASQIQGRSPWYLAWLRLRRNKVALAFGVLFILIVLFCLAAPLWEHYVAHTGPNENHLTDTVMIDGRRPTSSRPTAHPWDRDCTDDSCSAPTRTAVTSWCG